MRRSTVLVLVSVSVVAALGLGFAGGWFAHGPAAQVAVSSPPHGEGVVSGKLVMVGGRTNARYPVPGNIYVANIYHTGPPTISANAGPDGTFSVVVAPGTYEVFGTSPQFNWGKDPCHAGRQTVSVRAGQAITVDVQCDML